MAGKDIDRSGVEGEDYYIIRKSGREIFVPVRKKLPDGSMEPYSEDRQVRAYQLVQEGQIGGRRDGNGGGNGSRKKRISAAVVEEAQQRLQPKILRVLERGLNRSAGIKQNLATVKLITDMEHHEASLTLKEEEVDLSKQDRGELIGTLRALLEDPQTEIALEGIIEGTYEDIEDDEQAADGTFPLPRGTGSKRVSGAGRAGAGNTAQGNGSTGANIGATQADGADARETGRNGRRDSASDRQPRRNPWKEVANRGSDD